MKDVVEKLAVTKVETELARYGEMFESHILSNDKTPFWDGDIYVYRKGKKSKEYYQDRIFVQVKGVSVKKLHNKVSKFKIDVKDLRGYQKDKRGTLLFVAEIKSVDEIKLYYYNLLPVELKQILDNIKEKQKTVTLNIKQIVDKSPSSIKNICLNFLENSNQQLGIPIKSIDEIEEIKDIKFKVHCEAKYLEDYILSQDIYTYAITKDNEKIALPKLEKIVTYVEKKREVKIDNKQYYNSITRVKNEDEEFLLFGKAIKIYLSKNLVEIKLRGNIYERIRDIEFILSLTKNKFFEINGKKIDCPLVISKPSVNDFVNELKKKLKFLRKAKEYFERFKISFDIDLAELNDEDYSNFELFINMCDGKCPKELKTIKLYYIDIAKYRIAFVLMENQKGEKSIYNYFENLDNVIKTFYFNNKKEQIPLSIYINMTKENILTFSNFNVDIVKKTFEHIDNSEQTIFKVNMFALRVLQAYDEDNNRKELLDLSKYINNKLLQIDNNPIHVINKYQIIARERELKKKEKDELYNIKDTNMDYQIQTAIAILLNNKSDYERYLEKMDNVHKEQFNTFPINKLIN